LAGQGANVIVRDVRFVLVPGAGGVAWIWNRVVAEIDRAGHEAIAVDLPADDETKGLADYTAIVLREMNDSSVLVAASLGGFTAAMVSERKPPRALVLLNAMIPNPGEPVGAWWGNTGSTKARTDAANAGGYSTDFDVKTYFFHDMSEDLFREAGPHQRAQTERIFKDVCAFTSWPKIPIHVVAGRDDRFFPIEFQNAWHASASGSTSKKFPAATSLRSRTRRASPNGSSQRFDHQTLPSFIWRWYVARST
jgi:pimeloyl-ACP methyl ester carboxylesterase